MKKSSFLIFLGLFFISAGLFGSVLLLKKEKTAKVTDINEEPIKIDQRENIENTMVAGGDVILSRWVGVKIRRHGDSAFPFRKIGSFMASSDITFVNFESPFLDKGELITEGMVFKAEPDFVEGLTLAGVDVVSLANNHMKNQDREGLLYTFSHLKNHGIKYVGAGENYESAHQPAILESKGAKFGFLAYTYSDGIKFEKNDDPSIFDLAFLEVDQMRSDVEKLKKEADVVIVSMHAGTEYQALPNEDQITFAHAAIEAGANLVLGHHPHWVETTERYKNGYIIYSLGNLVFDQMWSKETREGVLARLKFQGGQLKSAEFVPIKIEDYSQPRFASDLEGKKILKRMGLESSLINLDPL